MAAPGTTYGDLKAAIADDLERNDLTGVIDRYAQEAIEYWQTLYYIETEAVAQNYAQTQSGVPTVTLPPNFEAMSTLQVEVANDIYPLNRRDFDYMQREWYNQDPLYTGPPVDYAIYLGTIYLGPCPDQAYNITATYDQLIPVPATDNVSNFWTVDGFSLILHWTEGLIRKNVLRPPDLGQADFDSAEQVFIQLQRQYADVATPRRALPVNL